MSQNKKHIYWTLDQKMALARAIKIRLAAGDKLTTGLVTKVNKEIFEPEFHRNIGNYGQIEWLQAMVDSLPDPGLVVKSPVFEPGEEKIVDAGDATHSSDPLHTAPSMIPNAEDMAVLLVEIMKPYLLDVAERTVAKSVEVIKGAVHSALVKHAGPEVAAATVYKIQPEKIPKKMTVVVVGLQNKEAARLDTEYGKTFRLKIYNDSRSLQELKNSLPTADRVVLATSNCSHTAQDVIKGNFPGKPIMVTGGLTSISKALRSLAIEQASVQQ